MTGDIAERLRTWSPSQCWSCGEWGCTNAAGHLIYCERDCVCDEHYDDIVCPSPCRECGGDDVCTCDCHLDLTTEAADEIELLRADVDRLRAAGEAMAAFMVNLPCYCVEGSNGEINETCDACGLAADWRDARCG
jgi:hypothetical protein